MSELDFGAFTRALEKSASYAGDPPEGRRMDLPRWLVDHEYDAAMAALYPNADTPAELLPRRQRLAILLGLAVLAWVPILVAGVVLWN